MDFKLIVFDWDGTLMDSEARIVACIQAAFADVGQPPPDRAAARNIIGLGLNEAMTELWPGAGAEERERLVNCYRRHFLETNETPSSLFDGAVELIEWLEGRGHLLAVATGKSRSGLEKVLASTGLKPRFHATRCADETFSKPHPQMLLELMDELGMRPSETLMIGDTEYDMQMARNAGTSVLAVCHGVHERERLLRHGPLDCLASLLDIPAWFTRRVAV
jgi:phosphoglycolate phosphatase